MLSLESHYLFTLSPHHDILRTTVTRSPSPLASSNFLSLMLSAFETMVTSRDGTGLDYVGWDLQYYYADPPTKQGFEQSKMRG